MEQERYGTWLYKKMTENSKYQELADCIRTEQLSAAQIQEEMKDKDFKKWYEEKYIKVKLPPVNPILKGKGWDNHEDSFEETLRREMLQYKGLYFLLQEDHKQLNESYYKVLERNKELVELNELLQKSNRELLKRPLSIEEMKKMRI